MSRTLRKMYPPYAPDLDSTRDKKKNYKPTKKFRREYVKKERAQAANAVRHMKSDDTREIPVFKDRASWDWN